MGTTIQDNSKRERSDGVMWPSCMPKSKIMKWKWKNKIKSNVYNSNNQ